MTRTGVVAVALGLMVACDGAQDAVVLGEDYQRVLDPLATATRGLDVLFVIDTSGSMTLEAQALIDAAGRQLFAQLDEDLGGMPDLRVGVITTSVAIGAASVPGCPATDDLNDGRFRIGRQGLGCPAIDGRYLDDHDDGAGGRIRNYTGSLGEAFACAAGVEVGTGCGFEHPLEAVRRAFDGRHPAQLEFLRDDALLLVVFITDEDDCSATNPALFGDPTATLSSELGPRTSFRCFEHGVVCDPDQPREFGAKQGCRSREDSRYLTPIDDYEAFFRGLKADPSLVMVTGMYAPPTDVVVGQDPDVLAPRGTPALLATCVAPATGVTASPAIRLDELVQRFPSRFVFESMCGSVMSERLRRITRATAGVMARRPCLLGRLDAETTTARCRGYDVGPDRAERRLLGCRAAGEQGCFAIAPMVACDYTPSGRGASYRGTLGPGHRLVVDCLAPAP